MKIWAIVGLVSLELVVVLLLFFGSIFAFAYLAYTVFELNNTVFDRQVFSTIEPYINEANTRLMNGVTLFASHGFLLPANIILAAYFIFKRHRWYSIKIPVVAISSYLLMALMKLYFERERPDDPVHQAAAGFSFPSGHAMSAMTFYGILIYLVWKNVKSGTLQWILIVLLVLFIFMIGFSRVYLRVHYASDVFAGFSLGLVWLVLSLWVMKKIENFTERKVAPEVNNDTPGS